MNDERGIHSVEALKNLHLEGNIIPMEWFAHLKFDNGKPDVNAILILSDIIYWYRPTQVRDEETGAIIGYRKKFKSDLLQKSYHYYAVLFGLSKRQVADAITRLEERGLIERVWRTVETPSATIHNVLFIVLDVEKVSQLKTNVRSITSCQKEEHVLSGDTSHFNMTSPMTAPDTEKVRQTQASVGGVTSYRGGYHVLSGDPPRFNVIPPTLKRDTYTKITTEITTKIPPPVPRAREVEVEVLDKSEDEDEEEIFKNMLLVWNTTIQHRITPDQDVFPSPERFRKLEDWQKSFGSSVTWEQYCNKITHSSFLMGENSSGFRVNLEWALNPNNVLKVLEGAIYDKPVKGRGIGLGENQFTTENQAQEKVNPDGDRYNWERLKAEIQEHSPPSIYIPEWLKVCEALSKILSPQVFKAWFLKVGLIGLTNDIAILLVNSAFMKHYLENHFQAEVEQAFRIFHPALKTIKFQVAEPQGEKPCPTYH